MTGNEDLERKDDHLTKEFLEWGQGWIEDRQPQAKHGETWKDLLP